MDVACVDYVRQRVDYEIVLFLRGYGNPAPISWSKVPALYNLKDGSSRFLICDSGNACHKVINRPAVVN